MQYPSVVQIETSGVCNASCSFCPHSTMNRTAQDKMSVEMFFGIIKELSEWETPPAQICPFLTNEPFADNRIYEFCKAINDYLPKANIVFFTNGSLFTDSNIEKLEQVANVGLIHCSLHHSTKEDYEADLKLNWEKTLASIHRLIDRKKWPVRLLRVQSDSKRKDLDFAAFCDKEFPGTPVQISYRYNWKGEIKSHITHENTLDVICPRHQSMTILCDGRVSLCCLDERGDYSLGDYKQKSLLEIYNGEIALKYRNQTKRMNSPCDKCNHPA